MTSKIFLIYLKYQCVITVYNPRGYCKKTVNGTQRNEVRKRYDFKNSKITKEKTLYEWKVNDDIYNLHSHRSKWKCGTRISNLMELEKTCIKFLLIMHGQYAKATIFTSQTLSVFPFFLSHQMSLLIKYVVRVETNEAVRYFISIPLLTI